MLCECVHRKYTRHYLVDFFFTFFNFYVVLWFWFYVFSFGLFLTWNGDLLGFLQKGNIFFLVDLLFKFIYVFVALLPTIVLVFETKRWIIQDTVCAALDVAWTVVLVCLFSIIHYLQIFILRFIVLKTNIVVKYNLVEPCLYHVFLFV